MDTSGKITSDAIDLSILIVSFNTRELTVACIASVLANTCGVHCELIVVDNASADGSADAISARFPDVKLVRLSENIGFARANNLAEQNSRGAHILLLNPDTIVKDDSIIQSLLFSKSQNSSLIVGGRTLYPDGSLNPTSCWGRPTLWSMLCLATGLTAAFRKSLIFNPEGYGGWQRDTRRVVDIVTGCFLLIPKATWDQLGGFDPEFFMYGEETDLCLRAARLGIKCMILPDAEIIHYGSASERVPADKAVRLFRAKAQLFHRHWSAPAAWWGIRLLDLWAASRLMASGLLSICGRGSREEFEKWKSVWRRRPQWRTASTSPLVERAPRLVHEGAI